MEICKNSAMNYDDHYPPHPRSNTCTSFPLTTVTAIHCATGHVHLISVWRYSSSLWCLASLPGPPTIHVHGFVGAVADLPGTLPQTITAPRLTLSMGPDGERQITSHSPQHSVIGLGHCHPVIGQSWLSQHVSIARGNKWSLLYRQVILWGGGHAGNTMNCRCEEEIRRFMYGPNGKLFRWHLSVPTSI